ncbi:early nodulin-like protein 1 [Amborella trichopoda]|uniref:Phytocyanin domain-containing protein n=1 Tax=Amborella trichopoda TaxID=13333 RepID=W1Q0C2_AMBTC|nr:early nodulin-like protein 1 [Amborella trichopoda]ERN13360.1 hypothetical protein AMTR_s00041p00135510 [Amborella trichopoda]|eukprot:XP_006851893.1 early nodulin-like protein 1 [Amborella trichopoda]
MGYHLHSKLCSFFQACLLLSLKIAVTCGAYEFKVGGLHAWGIPTKANAQIYNNWSKSNRFHIGDSLLFLYPPSQDSVIQVAEEAYNGCKTSDPILAMDDGNSLFNLTKPGKYFFISGVAGHCEKSQKLEITVFSSYGDFYPPSSAPSVLPSASSPSYATVFGPMPMPSSSERSRTHFLASVIAGIGAISSVAFLNLF